MVIDDILKRSVMGIGFAGLLTFVFLTIFVLQGQEIPLASIWLNMLGSLIMGIFFGLASFIFDQERWSLLFQISLHFCLSIVVFSLVSVFLTGWIPLTFIAAIRTFLFFVFFYAIFMLCEYLYVKQLVKTLNRTLEAVPPKSNRR